MRTSTTCACRPPWSRSGRSTSTNTQTIENGLSVDVALENGHRVNVMVLKTTDPHVGDHVQITEHRHRTGRLTYTWK